MASANAEDRWQKPADKPMPPLAQDAPAAGNATVLVVLDSSAPASQHVRAAVLAPLHHWGVPYELCDLSRGPLEQKQPRQRALVLLAQEALAGSLRGEDGAALLNALRSGTGLLSLDPAIEDYPSDLRDAIGLRAGPARPCAALRIGAADHFITAWHESDETTGLLQPVSARELAGGGESALLLDDAGRGPLLAATAVEGGGRVVWWGVSPLLWTPDTLGYGWGLDDLVWRGLVWAARKPFAIKAMPPMLTMRYDDCSGSNVCRWLRGHLAAAGNNEAWMLGRASGADGVGDLDARIARATSYERGADASVVLDFQYAKILGEHGWKPELGLFVDNIGGADWAVLKELHDGDRVELSCHALADGYTEGRWWSRFVYQKGMQVERHGRRAQQPSVGLDVIRDPDARYRVAPYSDAEQDQVFRYLDQVWSRHGITPSPTVNVHWRNPASNCLRFLKDRGQTFLMEPMRCNHAFCDPAGYDWRLLPYGNQGMVCDYLPVPQDAGGVDADDFFLLVAHPVGDGATNPFDSDLDYCRAGKPVAPQLLTHADPDCIARTIARHAQLGLRGLFFGCPMTHEMNLASLNAGEWREVLQHVDKLLARQPRTHAHYNDASHAARAKCRTHIDRAERSGGKLSLTLSGDAAAPVWLHAYRDEGDGCTQRLVTAGPFAGVTTVEV